MVYTVNFTREPIIETIITPREGCKLSVRSSKSEGQEEYVVDAVEVVSFGQALFFRSMERPKPFLVPVGDYEVVETKESRVVLKNAQFDRTIKIGGGREASIRREAPGREEEDAIPAHFQEEEEETAPAQQEQRFERKEGGGGRDRGGRRHRRRRAHEEREEMRAEVSDNPASSAAPVEKPQGQETSSANIFTSLIPPPTTLISDTISRYKEMTSVEPKQEAPKAEEKSEPKEEEKKPEAGEGNSLNRTMAPPSFAPLSDWTNFIS